MPEYGGATPQAIFKGTSEPSASDYSFFINTSTGEVFYSDGSTFTEIPTAGSNVSIAVVENALSILEIQAADALTPGSSAQIASDVFSDSDGYNDTLDTGNTTAKFDLTDTYENLVLAGSPEGNGTISQIGDVTTLTTSCTAAVDGIVTTVKTTKGTGTSSNYKIDIIQNAVTLATKTVELSGATSSVTFALSDYTNGTISSTVASGVFSVVFTQQDGDYQMSRDDSDTYSGTNFSYTTQPVSAGTDTIQFDQLSRSDAIVQTSAISLPSTPSKFLVFAYKTTESGTGSIDCDISFDNGANYQTGVSLETETDITNTGSTMILKLNLNAGASSGTAKAKGYGVLFW